MKMDNVSSFTTNITELKIFEIKPDNKEVKEKRFAQR